jgi:hypothetical protein
VNGVPDKKIVGIVEEVEIRGKKTIKSMAIFDSGARMNSIDVRLAAQARLGPIVRTTKVSQASQRGQRRRPVVETRIRIKGRLFDTLANIQDREHMTFPVIIGRNIITGNFIIDTRKNHELFERMRKEMHAGRKQA